MRNHSRLWILFLALSAGSCKDVEDLGPKCAEDVSIGTALDLEWQDSAIDSNGIPWAPLWRIQNKNPKPPSGVCSVDVDSATMCGGFSKTLTSATGTPSYGGDPACSTQSHLDLLSHEGVNADAAHALLNFLIPRLGPLQAHRRNWSKALLGHLNWWPVTYTGRLTLDEAGGADRDLNFALLPDERRAPMTIKQLAADAGLKLEGLGRLHLEINAEQSVKHFGKEGPLGDFVGMHESSKKKMEKLRSKVSGRRAIATGLLALDLDHEVFTELHPLYSLAWQQPCDAGGKTREIWDLIFANSGAQGWVSSGLNHYLGLLRPSFTIEFPTEFPESDTPSLSAMEIAKVVEEANAKLVASRDGGVKYKIIATQARRVALQLLWSGEITTDVRVHGTVTLNWPRPVTCPDSKGGSIGYPKSHRIEDSAESLEALRGLTESDRAKGFNATEEKDDLDLDETQVARCENCGELEWRGKPEPSECAPAKVCDYFPLDKSHPTQAVTLGRELRGICAAPSVNRLRGLLKRKASSDTDLASLQRLCDALTKK